MSVVQCSYVQFSYHKIAHCTAQYSSICSAVQYYLQYGVVTLFCERFWLVWGRSYGLNSLVNTPNYN